MLGRDKDVTLPPGGGGGTEKPFILRNNDRFLQSKEIASRFTAVRFLTAVYYRNSSLCTGA